VSPTPTPWGFTVEDAIDALRERRAIRSALAALGEARDPLYPCKASGCSAEVARAHRYTSGLCPRHHEMIAAHRRRTAAEVRVAAEEARRASSLSETQKGYLRDFERATADESRRWYAVVREQRALLAEVRAVQREVRQERLAARRSRYTGPPRRGLVYVIRDASNRVLYVGKTYLHPAAQDPTRDLRRRLLTGTSAHAFVRPWWHLAQTVEAIEFASEALALEAEVWVKQALRPLHDDEGRLPKADARPRARKRHPRIPIASL
jgi:hypothetical protein